MVSLIQIVKGLNDIANAHLQIRDFRFDDLNSFITSGATNYVCMLVHEPDVMVTKDRHFTLYKTRIYLFDKVLKDESNKTEVLSDLIRIAEDVIAEIKNPSWTWYVQIDQRPVIEHDYERTMDWLAATWFDVEFRLPTPDNRCQIPETSITRF